MKQPEGLISVLLNRSYELGDRHDAGMDLSAFDEAAALSALVAVASDPSEPEDLLDCCGESIGEIWKRQGTFDRETFDHLTPVAQELVRGFGLVS